MLLYIGNKLSKYGNTPTSVETLGMLLSEHLDIVTTSNKKNKVFRLLDMVFSIIVYRNKITIVLIDTYSTSNFYYALICAVFSKILSLRYIPILHGGKLPDRLAKNPILSNYIFKNAYINVSPSTYLHNIFTKHGFRTILIPNSIELDKYFYKVRLNVKPKLLYVRAFSEVYNPMLAIKVLLQLLKVYPDAELCMVGPDKDGTLSKVKSLVDEYDINDKVIFTGKLDKSVWIELAKDYDVFINTSNIDNTPVSLIEAMALGLYIVSTNVGGIPDLVEDGVDGSLVEPENESLMADKMHFLISNPGKAQKMAACARRKAEHFDQNKIISEWIKLLETAHKVGGAK